MAPLARARTLRATACLTAIVIVAAAAPLAAQPSFEQLTFAGGEAYTGLAIGPDGKLYAGTLEGKILRYTRLPDGTRDTNSTLVITALTSAAGGPRAVIGLAFDPAATALNPILWVSHSHSSLSSAPDWEGKISRLSGANLEQVTDYVIRLPRSIRDHMSNGIAFGPDGALYLVQGGNTAMGAADESWAWRPERLLSAAVLRIDLAAITAPPLDVQTSEGGTYDPFAPAAPVTIHASGLRNAYDLVWHTNGRLYVPDNGSTSGGNIPATPDPLPADCQDHRLDGGPYTGPQVPGFVNVPVSQNDFLYRIEPLGYYGHPNPTRCEWVLNGGNPTSGSDPAEVADYPSGTLPDRNWRGSAFDFGVHWSPNGILEYRSNVFGPDLRGKLLVIRYSQGNDIIVLTPGGPNQDIVESRTDIEGFSGFSDPLDLVEDPATGRLYVGELAPRRIRLLRPLPDPRTAVERGEAAPAPGSGFLGFVPNPFSPSTMIRYRVARDGPVTLRIHGPRGELIRELVHESQPPGAYEREWDGTDARGTRVAPGIYYLRITARDRTASGQIALLR